VYRMSPKKALGDNVEVPQETSHFCDICERVIGLGNGGMRNWDQHVQGRKHGERLTRLTDKLKKASSTQKITSFFSIQLPGGSAPTPQCLAESNIVPSSDVHSLLPNSTTQELDSSLTAASNPREQPIDVDAIPSPGPAPFPTEKRRLPSISAGTSSSPGSPCSTNLSPDKDLNGDVDAIHGVQVSVQTDESPVPTRLTICMPPAKRLRPDGMSNESEASFASAATNASSHRDPDDCVRTNKRARCGSEPS